MSRKDKKMQAAQRLADTKRTETAKQQSLYDFEIAVDWADNNPDWISMDEKLPENDGGFSDMVLVYTKDKRYYTAQFNYISNCWMAECPDDEITHWMNLPKPPTQ